MYEYVRSISQSSAAWKKWQTSSLYHPVSSFGRPLGFCCCILGLIPRVGMCDDLLPNECFYPGLWYLSGLSPPVQNNSFPLKLLHTDSAQVQAVCTVWVFMPVNTCTPEYILKKISSLCWNFIQGVTNFILCIPFQLEDEAVDWAEK